MADQLDALQTALRSVSKDWKTAKRSADREDRVSRQALQKMRAPRCRPPTIKDAAYNCMEKAYLQASAGGTLSANARMIMYAARPLVLAELGYYWKNSSTFTQHYLPDYIEEYGCYDWNVVFDARGHFSEPHGGERFDLGTIEVRRYLESRARAADDLDPSSLIATRFPTAGPANRYQFALFVEKEGFNPLLEDAQVAERFDIAIMSTKGMSSTAARELVENLSNRDVTILVLHDFDSSGFTILRTLRSDTRRYAFAGEPNVVDLGLRLTDVEAMRLESESVDYPANKDPRWKLCEAGATQEECDYLVRRHDRWGWHGERVELNAMTADQFVTWLEAKLVASGVEKLVPDAEVLDSAYRRAVRLEAILNAIKAALAATNGDAIDVPDDLVADVTARITGTADSWDDAVRDIVQDGETTG